MSKQLLRSSTSIGANVQEGINSMSKKEFIYKINLAYKEANESKYWLRLLAESDIYEVNDLIAECQSIIKILNKIIQTSKSNSRTIT